MVIKRLSHKITADRCDYAQYERTHNFTTNLQTIKVRLMHTFTLRYNSIETIPQLITFMGTPVPNKTITDGSRKRFFTISYNRGRPFTELCEAPSLLQLMNFISDHSNVDASLNWCFTTSSDDASVYNRLITSDNC